MTKKDVSEMNLALGIDPAYGKPDAWCLIDIDDETIFDVGLLSIAGHEHELRNLLCCHPKMVFMESQYVGKNKMGALKLAHHAGELVGLIRSVLPDCRCEYVEPGDWMRAVARSKKYPNKKYFMPKMIKLTVQRFRLIRLYNNFTKEQVGDICASINIAMFRIVRIKAERLGVK